MRKACFKCGERKPLSDFYKHPMMADGHLGKCKECAKADVRKNRAKRIEYYREYDRARASEPSRVAQRIEWHRSMPPEARAAHRAVSRAVAAGVLRKPKKCPKCRKRTPARRMHGHHEDYSKPLDVQWLCASCHMRHHKAARS